MPLTLWTPAPHFKAESKERPDFAFGNVAGRHMLIAFLPHPGPERDAALKVVSGNRRHFANDERLFFGVLPDRASLETAPSDLPWHWFLDEDGDLRRLYQAVDDQGELSPMWIAIDPSQRVLGSAPLHLGDRVMRNFLRGSAPDAPDAMPNHAPVLVAPRIFEPEFCRELIDLYNQVGGQRSGVARERDGTTYNVVDNFKRRCDATIQDEALKTQIRARLRLRLIPEIEKAFGFFPTRIERYIVACYDAEDGGYFRAHRDNTTPATAHRRFACSINLNAEEFEGGDLRFPEFGMRTYRPPTGGAVVFSCSVLHEARPVTRGTRYAFLPFLHDEAAEQIRLANLHTLVEAGA